VHVSTVKGYSLTYNEGTEKRERYKNTLTLTSALEGVFVYAAPRLL